MPIFQYKAKRKDAQTVLGTIDAQTKEEAVEQISQQGLVPVYIEESQQGAALPRIARPRPVASKDVYFFTRQLANLVKSGIPILRTLELIAAQIRNPYFKQVIEEIRSAVRDGKNFSDSLAEHPTIFSNLYVTMIRAGEESGNLKETVAEISAYLRDQQEIASKVRMAVAYPIFMGVFGVGTVCFILTYVMPKITTIFTNFDQELPLATRAVMSVSDFLIHQWYWIVIGILLFVFAVKQWDRSPQGRLYKGKVQLGLPLFGAFLLKAELSRFCRTLQLLLKSGIPIVRALQLAAPVVGNEAIQSELRRCQEDLLAGNSLGGSLRTLRYVPAMLGDLITIGEESGSLSSTLNDIAESYEQETNEFIKLMTTLLEPAMILGVGSVIGLIVIAMLLPIFQLDIFAK